MAARVASISVAPVKALALVHPDEVLVERFGVRENRRFHLIDEDGRMVNGKRFGRLVQVVPSYHEEADTLSLRFPDGAVVADEIRLAEPLTTDFYGRPVAGHLVAGPWAAALSSFADTLLRLVRVDEPGAGADRGRRGPVSLVSTASLDALARAGGLDGRVDGRRFRMLFVIAGTEAHEEDCWLDRHVRVGDAVVVPRGHVGRCAITTHNPETGRPDFATLKVLKAYRGDVPADEPLPFGVFGEVAEAGRVRIGDPVAAVA